MSIDLCCVMHIDETGNSEVPVYLQLLNIVALFALVGTWPDNLAMFDTGLDCHTIILLYQQMYTVSLYALTG